MEEQRAKAGGIIFGQNTSPVSSGMMSNDKQDSNSKIDVTDELLKLKKLLDEGVLSDAEFQEMKSKILSKNTQNF